MTADQEPQTPARIVAQLTRDPGEPPAGFLLMTGDDMTMGAINSGDLLGLDGRWCPVVGCVSLNGWVTVDTKHGYPVVTAYWNEPIHLARRCQVPGAPQMWRTDGGQVRLPP